MGADWCSEPAVVTNLGLQASLSAELAAVGAQAVAHTVANFDALAATGIAQAELAGTPTKAPKITKRHGEVDWTTWSTTRFHAVFRAVGHQIPIKVRS